MKTELRRYHGNKTEMLQWKQNCDGTMETELRCYYGNRTKMILRKQPRGLVIGIKEPCDSQKREIGQNKTVNSNKRTQSHRVQSAQSATLGMNQTRVTSQITPYSLHNALHKEYGSIWGVTKASWTRQTEKSKGSWRRTRRLGGGSATPRQRLLTQFCYYVYVDPTACILTE